MAITTKQLDQIILAEKPVNMVDVAGDTGFVTILHRYKDHGRIYIRYRERAATKESWTCVVSPAFQHCCYWSAQGFL